MAKKSQDDVDWKLATWDGAKREVLRRWAALPLERIVAALEEMQELNETLSESTAFGKKRFQMATGRIVQEQRSDYSAGTESRKSNREKKRDGDDDG